MVAFNSEADSEHIKRRIAFVEEILHRTGVYQSIKERKENLLWMIDWVQVRIAQIDVQNPSSFAVHVLSSLVSTTKAMKLYAKYYELGIEIVNQVVEQQLQAERKAGEWLQEFGHDSA